LEKLLSAYNAAERLLTLTLVAAVVVLPAIRQRQQITGGIVSVTRHLVIGIGFKQHAPQRVAPKGGRLT
jgi:hypothetical protein